MRNKNHDGEKASALINVDDVAVVGLIFKGCSNFNIQVILRVKKNDNKASKSTVLNITCGQSNKLIFCSDDWMETIIATVNITTFIKFIEGIAYLYVVTVNITEHNTMSTPSLPISNKFHTDKKFTDFQLVTADGSVPVHKAMLFFHSDMFRTMLSGEWKETAEGRINIEGVTVQTLQHLKDYMYLGTLPDEGLEQLLVIALRYLMDNLKIDCIAKLVKTIKPENFDGLVEYACQNNMPELVKALVFQIPDGIVNSIHQLKVKEESNDKE